MQHDYPREEILDGLAPGVRPEQVDGLAEAEAILPIFPLVRSLFSTAEETDTLLKLVVLFCLAQTEGRFSRERIRSQVRALSEERLDALVTSLHKGRWLELRAQDNTYRLNPLGLYLLAVLRAANFASQTPANLLVRAAEALAFGDRVDEEGATTSRLLGMLLAELESQAERAGEIIRLGRPRQLVQFSRGEVRQQITHVTQVLAAIEERLDEASEHFGRVVRIHEAMQQILRAHEGISRRLAEWSLRKLETTDAGYSLSALCDAAMGADRDELLGAVQSRAVSLPARAVALSTDEVMTRYRTGRRRAQKGREQFVYVSPPEPETTPLRQEDIDPVARLRKALAQRVARLQPGERLPLDRWLGDEDIAQDFTNAVFQLNLLARMEGQSGDFAVDLGDGVKVLPELPQVDAEDWRGLDPQATLVTLERLGLLVRIPGRGLHLNLGLVKQTPGQTEQATDG